MKNRIFAIAGNRSVPVYLLPIVLGGLLVLGAGCQSKQPEQKTEQQKTVSGQADGFATSDEHPVTATLVAEHTAILPGGETRVGVLFEMEDGWHIYGEEPGDAGLPTTISWSASSTSFGELQWPTPQRLLDPGDIETFGYEKAVLLSSPLTHTRSGDSTPSALGINAQATWLTCKKICIPGSANLEIVLPISADAPVLSLHASLFDDAD